MKKFLSLLLTLFFIVLLTGGYLVFSRFQKAPESIVPFPYVFKTEAPQLKPDAPIMITGDRMGSYFGRFSTILAETISRDLAKPIEIQSIAKPGHGIHRTLHELKSLTQWPQIIIFQGASEEFREVKFMPSEIPDIKTNFKRYNDDRIETLLILYPWLSRIVYEPIKRVTLTEGPDLVDEITQKEYLRRLETELLLFEQHLVQLVLQSKDRNSLLILTTTPINLDEPPRKICDFSRTTDIDAEIITLRDYLEENNPKSAYTLSSKLLTQHLGNAELHFLHGQVAKRLGYMDEAIASLLRASAFDCSPWRTTELHNSLIRKVAQEHQVILFDFAKLLQKEFPTGTTFFDEIHPQNLYYEKAMEQLGLVIKEILKL